MATLENRIRNTLRVWKCSAVERRGRSARPKNEKKVLHIVDNKLIYIQGVADCTGNLILVPNGEREITERLI
jgi:hypothetical protein